MSTGAITYIVQTSRVDGDVSLDAIVTSQTSVVIDALQPGFAYLFTVKAVSHQNLTSDVSREIQEQTGKQYKNNSAI